MATRSRPAQGNNSTPVKPPRAAYKADAPLTRVNLGSVSHPSKIKPWRPGTLAQDAAPKVTRR